VPAPAPAQDAPPPAPDEYQADLVETIRDTARYVAHEFNNALTAILLPVQLAIRQVPNGGDLHSNLQDAYESARRAADLAKDFLDCFRPRAPRRERCRLGSLLGRALRLATCAQNVQWALEVPDDLFDVDADSNQIERVMFNLVRNACQAMPGGGKLLVKACNTAVSAAEGHTLTPGNYVHISVRDWGPGIPEEHLPHLFHSCFTTKTDGNGCGLPICYQIVRDHGGDMYVKTRDKVGTAFLIFLPALAAPAEIRPEPASAPVPMATASEPPVPAAVETMPAPLTAGGPPPPLTTTNAAGGPEGTSGDAAEILPALLVVDDEAKILIAFSKIGKFRGFDVTTAATSEEGLQYFRDRLLGSHPYDSVVVDINLRGGMNGMEVFEAIRRINSDVPVIATSGQCSEEELEHFAEMGFAGFLPKPFTIEQFDEVMEEVLAPV
jgi:two-component system cell cycle sensor histidine kinase/response regulator CckA